jgi:hypothetical protein
MSKLKTNIAIKNKYELELYSADGELKSKAYAYNVVTKGFWEHFFTTSNFRAYYFNIIAIGTGTGTPSASDPRLFNQLASATSETISMEYAYPTSTKVVKATFPASASVVGTITEVGFVGSDSISATCHTHALLQDSEGNTITIEKTDTDIIIVTAMVYITVTADESVELVNADRFHLLISIAYDAYLWSGKNHLGNASLCKCPAYPELSIVSSTEFPLAYSSYANRSRSTATVRLGSTTGNNTYINALAVDKFGKTSLPNPEIFPVYTLQPMSVGIGDGVTTEFVCPIPVFIEGTDVVTVNGAVMARDVDYTVDHNGNSLLEPSVAASNFVKNLSGRRNSSDVRYYTPGIAGNTIGRHFIVGRLSTGSDLVFDMGEDIECNTLFIDALTGNTSSPSSNSYNCTLILEYSADAEVWNEAVAATGVKVYGNGYLSNIPEAYKNKLFSFNAVTARYWRLRVAEDFTAFSELSSGYGNMFFGRVGQGIVFTSPPADGAVITIAADVDRPYKTADYVLDYSLSIYY